MAYPFTIVFLQVRLDFLTLRDVVNEVNEIQSTVYTFQLTRSKFTLWVTDNLSNWLTVIWLKVNWSNVM